MPKIKDDPYPNSYDCSECPDWDFINGCWANESNSLQCWFRLEQILNRIYLEITGYQNI